jgi:hypothetical protein
MTSIFRVFALGGLIMLGTLTLPAREIRSVTPGRIEAAPGQAGALAGGRREPLRPENLEFIGVLRVPRAITGYGGGGLTHRVVDGRLRFFVMGHRHEDDPVFELDVPGFADELEDAPRASIVGSWGDIYRDRKLAEPEGASRPTRDLEWFDDRLYWVYGHDYNVAGFHNPSIGSSGGDGSAAGPWHTSLHSHLTEGYITTIPAWFANQYLDGRRFAVGAGLLSGNSRSSWGPMLAAIPVPAPGRRLDQDLDARTLVRFSIDDRLARENTYTALTRPPDLPGGLWTQQDFIRGAVWVDTGDLHGVIFFGALAEGRVWYGREHGGPGYEDSCGEWTGPHAERYVPRWWFYDPMQFAPVSRRTEQVRPLVTVNPHELAGASLEPTCMWDVGGATFDSTTNRLYVLYLEGEPSEGGNLPVIYAFQIRRTTTQPAPNPGRR